MEKCRWRRNAKYSYENNFLLDLHFYRANDFFVMPFLRLPILLLLDLHLVIVSLFIHPPIVISINFTYHLRARIVKGCQSDYRINRTTAIEATLLLLQPPRIDRQDTPSHVASYSQHFPGFSLVVCHCSTGRPRETR